MILACIVGSVSSIIMRIIVSRSTTCVLNVDAKNKTFWYDSTRLTRASTGTCRQRLKSAQRRKSRPRPCCVCTLGLFCTASTAWWKLDDTLSDHTARHICITCTAESICRPIQHVTYVSHTQQNLSAGPYSTSHMYHIHSRIYLPTHTACHICITYTAESICRPIQHVTHVSHAQQNLSADPYSTSHMYHMHSRIYLPTHTARHICITCTAESICRPIQHVTHVSHTQQNLSADPYSTSHMYHMHSRIYLPTHTARHICITCTAESRPIQHVTYVSHAQQNLSADPYSTSHMYHMHSRIYLPTHTARHTCITCTAESICRPIQHVTYVSHTQQNLSAGPYSTSHMYYIHSRVSVGRPPDD